MAPKLAVIFFQNSIFDETELLRIDHVVLGIPVVAKFVGSTQGVKLVVLQKKLWYSDASKLLFLHQNAPVSNMSVLCACSGHKNMC